MLNLMILNTVDTLMAVFYISQLLVMVTFLAVMIIFLRKMNEDSQNSLAELEAKLAKEKEADNA